MLPDLVPGTVREGWGPSIQGGRLRMGPLNVTLAAGFLAVGDAFNRISPIQYLPAGNFPALTGDISTSAGSLATTLSSVISAGGPIGSSSIVPVITYDAKGRLTTVTSATITAAAIGAQPLDTGLTSLAGLAGAGYVKATATDTFSMQPGVPWADVTGTPTTIAGYGIADAQPLDGDLTAIAALPSQGFAVRSAANTWVQRNIVSTSSALTILDGNGVALNPSLSLSAILQSLGVLANSPGQLTNDGSGVLSWSTGGGVMARQYAWSVAS